MLCDKFGSCPNQETSNCKTQASSPSLPSCIRVLFEHDVYIARRHSMQRTGLLGMSSLESCYIATAVSELANNMFFHTHKGGVIHFRRIEKDGKSGIEISGHDEGAGIENIAQAMVDGFSSNQGLGAGLGGMRRLMDEFEITSILGVGTSIVMRKWISK